MTCADGVSIRDATEQDAAFLARVMLLSARSHLHGRPGFWEKALDRSEADCLAYLEQLVIVEPRSPTHWTHFLLAELDGQRAAALSGYISPSDGRQFGGVAMMKADEKLGRTKKTMETAAYLSARSVYQKCEWREDPGVWTIEFVATLPEFERRGVMTCLLKRALAKGRATGCTSMRVQVFVGNTPAERVYTKTGFIAVPNPKCDHEFQDFFGAPGIKLLRRTLTDISPVA